MNFVILCAVISAGSSSMYASSRTLMNMSIEGKAPKIFQNVNSRGVPMYALIMSTLIGCLIFLGSKWDSNL